METKLNPTIELDPSVYQWLPVRHNIKRIEVHPCNDIGGGVIETCSEEDADFYSVYANFDGAGMSCIADCINKASAESLAELLEFVASNKDENFDYSYYKPKENETDKSKI